MSVPAGIAPHMPGLLEMSNDVSWVKAVHAGGTDPVRRLEDKLSTPSLVMALHATGNGPLRILLFRSSHVSWDMALHAVGNEPAKWLESRRSLFMWASRAQPAGKGPDRRLLVTLRYDSPVMALHAAGNGPVRALSPRSRCSSLDSFDHAAGRLLVYPPLAKLSDVDFTSGRRGSCAAWPDEAGIHSRSGGRRRHLL